MIINEDYSYVTDLQKEIVDKGLGNYSVKYINISCDKDHLNELKELCDAIDHEFLMYQYRKNENGEYICSYKDMWDIFYWGGEKLVKLSFNDKKSSEERMLDIERLLKLLRSYSNNIEATIQYTIKLVDEEIVKNKAKNTFKENENKFITRNGIVGKIKKVNRSYEDSFYGYSCDYGFFKKGSKGKYYQITNVEIAII